MAGFPAATTFSGIFLVTTALCPITEFLPIVTPFKMVTLSPIKTFSSIKIASDFGVTHQSPQIIVVKNGAATANFSHQAISVDRLRKEI